MNRTRWTSMLALIALTGIASAAILNVPDDYATIQAAVDSSADGDTVLVQPEVYTEIVNYNGKNIVVASLFLTTGDTAYITSTIIDGGANGRSVVVFRNSEDSTAVLTGFTIRNGDTDYGGGIYIRGTSPTISHLVVSGCRSDRVGGGIYCTQNSAPLLSHIVVTGNSSGFAGGGIGCYSGSQVVVTDALITGNSSESGGGIYNATDSRLVLERSIIADNEAAQMGGGIHNDADDLLLNECVISGNSAGSDGGGIACIGNSLLTAAYSQIFSNHAEGSGGAALFEDAQASLLNVTIADNRANLAGAIYILANVALELRNCILWNSDDWVVYGSGQAQGVILNYCNAQGGEEGIDIQGNLVWGDGNLAADPLFFNAGAGDYRLFPSSPCIDAGDPDSPPDPDSSRADMGALPFYHHPNLLFGSVTVARSGEPVANATLNTSFGYHAVTDSAGYYSFTSLPVGEEFSLQVLDTPGYIRDLREGLVLNADDSLQVDFALFQPIFTPSEWELEAALPPDSATTLPLIIRNDGDYDLRWNSAQRMRGVDVPPWGQLASLELGGALGISRINSALMIEDRYYAAYDSDSDMVAVLDRDLQLLALLPQFGDARYGYQDMAWDGGLLWGSGEEELFGFTTGGELVKRWGSSFRTANAIAWDPDRQCLWVGSVTGRWLVAYDRDGNAVGTLDQKDMLVYGLAYWSRDPDGYQLYILNASDVNRSVIMKMNPATGDTITLLELHPQAGGRLRSADICDDYLPTVWTFVALNDNPGGDLIDVWLLNGEPGWLTLTPEDGAVAPQDESALQVSFSTADLDTGLYQAEIEFAFPEIAAEAVITATLRVTAPDGIPDFAFRNSQFALGEAYPNPFNQSSVISYQLSAGSKVNLELYDLTGRLMATLVDEVQPAGHHRVIVGGQAGTPAPLLPTGVYLLKLTAGREVAVRKVACVR